MIRLYIQYYCTCIRILTGAPLALAASAVRASRAQTRRHIISSASISHITRFCVADLRHPLTATGLSESQDTLIYFYWLQLQ
ncbi:hypothetical protein BGY98DRAFT_970664, partial [Russula aff. rugulosa BPL654]